MEQLELYAVRNQEGQWFRRKGYGGYGKTWVDDFKLARIYSKIGPARAIVSFFTNRWPEYGVPDLVVLKINEVVVLDESARVSQVKEKKKKEEERREIRQKEWELERATKALEEAQARFAIAKGESGDKNRRSKR
jgi:hypothetical protein